MAKKERSLSVSAWFLRLGDALRFAPEEGRVPSEKEERSFRLIPPQKLLTAKSALARIREQSFFVTQGVAFIRELMLTRFRSFSTLFFVSGLIQTVSYFVGSYLPVLSGNQDNLVIGLILIILGLVAAFERLSLGALIKRSFAFRRIVQPLFGVADREIPEGGNREHLWWMLGSGAVLGFLSVAFSPYRVILWIILTVAGLTTLYKPEAGLVFTSLLYPFLPRTVLLGMIVLLHLSLIAKIGVGKRSLVRSPADVPVLILILMLAVAGGLKGLSCALILSVYFLGAHLCRTVAWLRRVTVALSVSACASFLAPISLKLLNRFAPEVIRLFPGTKTLLTGLTGREYAALAVLMLPMLFCTANTGRTLSTRFLGVIALLLAALPLAASHDPGLWLGAVLGLVLTLVLARRWGLLLCVCAGLSGYTSWMLLPDSARRVLIVFFGMEEDALTARSEALLAGREKLRHALPWGLGKDAFASISGGESAYQRIGLFGGILALVALAVIAVWFFVRCLRFSARSGSQSVHPLVLGGMAGVFVWLVSGFVSSMTALEPLFVLSLFLSFPKAAECACRREEYRQPY